MQGEASTRLGFTDYFRVELAWARLLGAVLLLAPVPARLKEWAYAAFAIPLGSALIAHLSIGGRSVQSFEMSHLQSSTVDCRNDHVMQTDRIRTVGGSRAEYALLFSGAVTSRMHCEHCFTPLREHVERLISAAIRAVGPLRSANPFRATFSSRSVSSYCTPIGQNRIIRMGKP